MPIAYDNDGRIKRPGKKIQYDDDMLFKYAQCIQDVKFFAENFYYVVHQVEGAQVIKLRNYQEKILNNFQDNRLNLLMSARQIGKTTCAAIYLLWFACFQRDKTIAILANKASTAMAILDEIKFAYERLPEFIKPGVEEYNKQSVEFDNGCKLIARATSKDALRGESAALIFLDEFAFLPGNLADEFWASNLPVISTGGKCIIVSTPNGTGNLFYSLWKDATNDAGGFPFVPLKVSWREVPGRDEQWEREMRQMLGNIRFNQEFECVGGDSEITKMNSDDIIERMSIKQLYQTETILESEDETHFYVYTKDNLVLSSGDFYRFNGIRRTKDKVPVYTVETESGKSITCTYSHKFYDENNKEIQCGKVIPNSSKILTINGPELVIRVSRSEEDDYVYDLLEVENEDNSFIANEIKNHNCQFQGSSTTLIDSNYILTKLVKKDPIGLPDEFTKMWDQAKIGRIYAISCDVGGGVGSDYSIINVFDITDFYNGGQAIQVAIWRCNTLPPTKMAEYLYNSAKYWNNAFVIIEVNPGGYGDDVCKELFEDYEYENIYFDIERGEYGIYAHRGNKPKAAQAFKSFLESDRIVLFDDQTIDEIGYFEEIREHVFQAKKGKNLFDDCVMSCLWMGYFLDSEFLKGEIFDYEKKKEITFNPENWYKKNNVSPEEETLQEVAEDPEAEEMWEAFLSADASNHDPDSWLQESEMEDFLNSRPQ